MNSFFKKALTLTVFLLLCLNLAAQNQDLIDKSRYKDGKKSFYSGDYGSAAVQLLFTSDKFRKSNPKAQYELLYACLHSKRINLGADAARLGFDMKGPKKMPAPDVVVEDLLELESQYKQSLTEARAAIGRGEYKEALDAADFAIDTDPNYPEAYVVRGRANLGLKAWRQASLDVEEIIQARIQDPEAYYVRAIARFGLGDEKNAVEDLNTSIKIKPTAEANFRRGQYAVSLNQGRRAINDLFTAVRLDATLWDARLLLGVVHLSEGDAEKALANFDEIIQNEGSFKDVFLERARANNKLEHFNEALSDYRKYLRQFPNDAQGHFELGNLLTQQFSGSPEKTDSALIHLNKAVISDGANTTFLKGRALAYNTRGRYADAIRDVEAALKVDPTDFELYSMRLDYQARGKVALNRQIKGLEEALVVFENETTKARKGPGFYNKARIFALRQSITPATQWLDSAIVNIDEAIANGRSESDFHLERGRLFWHLKKSYDEAEKSIKQALNLQPAKIEAHVMLINLYLDKGDVKAASQAMKDALKKLPDHQALKSLRESLCQKYPEGC
jgi:tetratricopeptide (TPR) repeat protein